MKYHDLAVTRASHAMRWSFSVDMVRPPIGNQVAKALMAGMMTVDGMALRRAGQKRTNVWSCGKWPLVVDDVPGPDLNLAASVIRAPRERPSADDESGMASSIAILGLVRRAVQAQLRSLRAGRRSASGVVKLKICDSA